MLMYHTNRNMSTSKQILPGTPASLPAVRRHLACIFTISLAICVLAITPSQFALIQEPATTAAARNAALMAATDEVLKETSVLRQLAVVRPVQSSTLSRAEIERAVVKNLDEELSAADMHAAEVTLKKLGLAPPNFQYRALMIRLLTEQVAGYYEPKTRQFHLADWIDVEGQKPVMAHELTHALQDQHFDLRRFEHWPKGDSDAELAAHALIEGDATLAMVMYVSSSPMRALTFLKSLGSMGVDTKELDQAPRVIRESLLFPYQEGLNWTRVLHKDGGWAKVTQAFTNLPQSTEQIMHPEKYLAHEAPVKVTLPDITSFLNTSGQRSEVRGQRSEVNKRGGGLNLSGNRPASNLQSQASWHRIASDVNGEWGTYLLLDQFLKAPTESHRAAAGWAGDRYAVYESSSGKAIFISVTAWDTAGDAREFFDAYRKRVELRYPGSRAAQLFEAPDRPMATASWKTDDGSVALVWSGSRVFMIEGCPDDVDGNRLMSLLARHVVSSMQ
jgi:hypothetical protein